MIQETHMEDTPTLPGYRAYSSPPSAREHGKGAAQGVCTFVRKGLTSIHHENFLGRSSIEHCVTEIGLGRRKQEPILLANIYSNPTHGQQKFKALLHKTTQTNPNGTVVVCGDFNAPHKELGYNRTSAKGRDLLEEASNAGFVLYTDPGNPTRIGTSTTRDTNPDLTFARLSGKARGTATWRNTGHNLGSDHYIIELNIPTTVHNDQKKFKHKLTDWARFRATLDEDDNDIEDIEKWTERVTKVADSVTAELDVEEEVPQIDSKLAHMIEARQSLQRRWKKQRHNRRLRKRVAELGRAIEKYSRELCTQQWHATCNAADGQLHKGQTWKLLRHLLDDKSTKGHQQHRLAQTIYTAVKTLGEEETSKRINAKYLPTAATEIHPDHNGPDNPELDREIEEWEVRAVLQELNCKSAAGPDRLHNRALRNLNDGAIAALTRYFNQCWREGQGTNTTDNEAKRHHALPERALRRLVVAPLPKNMHPEHSQGRRDARAKALTEAHANDNGALYVDAAKYKDKEDTYVAVAIRATTGEIYSACSVRAKQAHQAEEAAIALALADNKCTTILSDSRTAVRNYGRNNVCASAVRVVKCSDRQCTDGLRTRLRWFPAHQGYSFGSNSPNRNETANAAARGLTRRVVAPASLVVAEGVATDDEDDEEEAELVTSYADVLE
ncbi:hypothetical protein MTO96_046416, partial [Rhipicephalus appendiculatus]